MSVLVGSASRLTVKEGSVQTNMIKTLGLITLTEFTNIKLLRKHFAKYNF
jgi:hypothetical protein